jgi:hypothetical protein
MDDELNQESAEYAVVQYVVRGIDKLVRIGKARGEDEHVQRFLAVDEEDFHSVHILVHHTHSTSGLGARCTDSGAIMGGQMQVAGRLASNA